MPSQRTTTTFRPRENVGRRQQTVRKVTPNTQQSQPEWKESQSPALKSLEPGVQNTEGLESLRAVHGVDLTVVRLKRKMVIVAHH